MNDSPVDLLKSKGRLIAPDAMLHGIERKIIVRKRKRIAVRGLFFSVILLIFVSLAGFYGGSLKYEDAELLKNQEWIAEALSIVHNPEDELATAYGIDQIYYFEGGSK